MTTERSMRMPWARLEGKVVMVTGASSGLGHEFCLDLARAGCRIVAAARRIDRLRSLCDEINQMGSPAAAIAASRPPQAVAVELDVSAKWVSVEASVQEAWNAFGRIDALVNNAGVRGGVSSPLDLSEEEWNNVISTNLTGTWLVSKYVCRHMRDAKQKGSVINISSIAGLHRGQVPGGIAYTASKGGHGVGVGGHNIRVNSIAPGIFNFEIIAGLMQKDWINTVAMKTIPLRTYGTSDPALTSLVRYLIHDKAEYVTGNIFIVDAGATLPGVPLFSCL